MGLNAEPTKAGPTDMAAAVRGVYPKRPHKTTRIGMSALIASCMFSVTPPMAKNRLTIGMIRNSRSPSLRINDQFPPGLQRQGPRFRWALTQLKQRLVVRIVITYTVCLWLAAQLCVAFFPLLNMSHSVLQLVVAAGLAGLPTTILLTLRIRHADPITDKEDDPIAAMSNSYFCGLIMATCLLIILLILQTWP